MAHQPPPLPGIPPPLPGAAQPPPMPKPFTLAPRLARLKQVLPAELRDAERSVLWRWEYRQDKRGEWKWTKPPYQPDGRLAESNGPATWSTFETVVAAYQRGGFDGIGIVLSGDGLVGVDFDHCVEDSAIADWALAVIKRLGSYAEVSPSGTGIRVLAYGKLPPAGRSKIKDGHKVEVYEIGRYLTLTGHYLRGFADRIEERTELLGEFHAFWFGEAKAEQPRPNGQVASAGHDQSDDELLERARAAKNGAEFRNLFDHGDVGGYGGDRSAADLALTNHLVFWTTRDPSRADRLFRRSALMRPKWDERHYGNGETYGQHTIAKALETVREGWQSGGEARTDEQSQPAETAEGAGRRKAAPSQATELVHLAEEQYDFVCNPKKTPFAIPRGGPYVARPLRGGTLSVRSELAASYMERHGSVPRDGALTDAVRVLEGRAARAIRELHLRVARHGENLVLDLGRLDGQVAIVKPGSWEVTPGIPEVIFERTELTLELPVPERGGDLSELRALLNVTESDWPLVVGWEIAALFPHISHPLLLFRGEAGTAKTYAARLLLRLIDPSTSEVNGPPKDLENFVISAIGSQVVVFDNLRRLEEWLSDCLCRASTGEGIKKRTLYTDQAITAITFKRALILTGIDPAGIGEDLRERLLTAELEFIPDERRLLEEVVDERFRAAHPRQLGALLDLLCQVLAELPRVSLQGVPRMADFARIQAALDRVTGWEGFARYGNTRDDAMVELLEGDVLAQAVIRLMEEQTELRDGRIADGYIKWVDTPTQLQRELERVHPAARLNKAWPSQPNHLTGRLTRLAPALRRVKGIDIQSGREGKGKDRVRHIRITKAERSSDGADDQSQATSADLAPTGDTRLAAPIPTPPPTDVIADEEAAQMDDEYGEWSG